MTKRTESDLRAELLLQRELLADQIHEQFDIALALQRQELEEQIADLRRKVDVLADQLQGGW